MADCPGRRKSIYKPRIGGTLTRCPMRDPQLQGMHPAHSCHLMHDIREQRICKSKAVGYCRPCLVYGKAVILYLSIKAGFLLSTMHSSHQDITRRHSQSRKLPTRHLHTSAHTICKDIFSILSHLHPLIGYTQHQVQSLLSRTFTFARLAKPFLQTDSLSVISRRYFRQNANTTMGRKTNR